MSYLDLDFKSRHATPKSRPGRRFNTHRYINRFIRGLTVLATLVGAVYLIVSFLSDSIARVEDSNLKPERLHYSVLLPDILDAPAQEIPLVTAAEIQSQSDWLTQKIKTGDTLASIFDNAGLDAITTYKVAKLNDQTGKLTNIRPGQTISILQDDDKANCSIIPWMLSRYSNREPSILPCF